MDTASSLVWYPCALNKLPYAEPTNMSIFDPGLSSSAKVLGCTNPKCGWLANPNVNDRCQGCQTNKNNCNQPCPPYFYMNGYASSIGVFFSESLRFTNKAVMNDFVIGCSNTTSIWPAGVSGFGRGPGSLPAQMGIKKFSYCLVSHAFDDKAKSSELVLHTGPNTDENDITLQYTPFHRITEASFSVLNEYYYLSLEKISVGGVDVNVPSKYLVPESNGNGGLVVDSSSMLTYMDKAVYDMVSQQFEMLKNPEYARAPADMEDEWGLKPCFIVPSKNPMDFPELTLHFEGGAEMEISMMEYFSYSDDQDLACMSLVTSDSGDAGNAVGPSIVFGNYQQQDLYLEFDLENERLGFRDQTC
ncbi:uncharacterized protein LOC128071136 [Budorcas taxicolor]|uniref:uncharacterized protein LOC128071136 n=1 Tax=Budorcas taxicolor TaxID=37181 RepID=UPI0022841E7F|nr:uncharacterized protein LOC128071136 [Budorcas taxicolor]